MKMRLVVLLPATLLFAACGERAPSPTTPAPVANPTPAPVSTGIAPVDIPKGFGYPGDRAEFQAWADTWSIDNITTAAWDLWAGMTSDSGQVWNGSALPVWETWCSDGEVFRHNSCQQLGRPARAIKFASQIGHGARQFGQKTSTDTRVVAFNKFNPPMAAYLAEQHAGPGPASSQYRYTSMQSLADLNGNWAAATPVAQRTVVQAPYQPAMEGAEGFSAMETKPVIFLIKAKGLTPMPLWQGPVGAAPGAQLNAVPETWLTCVLLDPANTAGPDTVPVPASAEQIANLVPNPALSCQTYLYAPLSTIYHSTMDQAEADAWNALATNSGDAAQCPLTPTGATQAPPCLIKADAGDYAVLAGMHVNTKTIVDWTWQTFWWQPGADTPDAFPGSKRGMTDKVTGVWRNYAMCSAWNQTHGDASSDMTVCFNPFLETSTGIPDGQSSNCVSCHGVASVGAPAVQGTPPSNQITSMNYPADYVAPIDFDSNACTLAATPAQTTCLENFTRTDFSWAIPVEAVVNLPQPAGAASSQSSGGN